jgi:hypothetical protein
MSESSTTPPPSDDLPAALNLASGCSRSAAISASMRWLTCSNRMGTQQGSGVVD